MKPKSETPPIFEVTFFPRQVDQDMVKAYSTIEIADIMQSHPSLVIPLIHELWRLKKYEKLLESLYNLGSFDQKPTETLNYKENIFIANSLAVLREQFTSTNYVEVMTQIEEFYKEVLEYAYWAKNLLKIEGNSLTGALTYIETMQAVDAKITPYLTPEDVETINEIVPETVAISALFATPKSYDYSVVVITF